MRTSITQVSGAFRITGAALIAAIGLATPVGIRAQATLRPDQPEVIRPVPLQASPTPDFASEFRQHYAAAGSPRIMLFWNVELSDRGRAETVLRDNETKTGSKTASGQGQTIAGWDGRTTTINGNAQLETNRQREISIGERQDAKRANLPQRDAIVFERAFESEMRSSSARLVDRTMAVRTTATERSADGQQQLEGEAVRGKADLLLQVLFIVDNQAPLGYGFDVTMRDVNSGIVLTSFYTVAAPPSPPMPQGYVATAKGFERPAPPQLMLDDVAIELAHQIMNRVGPVLLPPTDAR